MPKHIASSSNPSHLNRTVQLYAISTGEQHPHLPTLPLTIKEKYNGLNASVLYRSDA